MAKKTTKPEETQSPDFSNLGSNVPFGEPIPDSIKEGGEKKEQVEETEVVEEAPIEESIEAEEQVEEPKEEPKTEEPVELDYAGLLQFELENGIIEGELPEGIEDMTEQDYIKTKQQLVDTSINKKVEETLDNILEDLDNQYDGAISHLIQGGNLKDFGKVHSMGYSSIEDKDIRGNLAKQKYIMEEYYKTHTRFGTKRIEKEITRLDDHGEIEDEALEVLPQLKEYETTKKAELLEQTKRQKEQEELQRRQMMDNMIGAVDKTKEFLGVPITGRLKSSITKDIENRAVEAKINKDYAKYLPVLTMLDRMGVLDGKVEMLNKYLGTRATKDATKKIKATPFKSKSTKATKGVEGSSDVINTHWWKQQ